MVLWTGSFASLMCSTKSLMPPSYWYVTSLASSRWSTSRILSPLFRKAHSRNQRLKVSKEKSWVSVKTSGSGRKRTVVPVPAELPAGVQRRHDDFGSWLAVLRHLAHRHTAPVVGDRDGVVRVDRYEYLRTVPGQGLVYGVVDDLPDEVVKTPGARRADVHTRAPLDGFEAFEDLDGTCIVSALGILGRGLSRQRTGPSSWSVRRRRRRCSFHRNSAPDDCNTFAAVSKQHFGPFAAYLSRFRRVALTSGTIRCGLQDGTTRYAYDTGSSQDLFVEIFEVGRRDHGLRALQKIPGKILPPPLVELAHHVVEEQDRVLPHSRPHVVPRRELERQRRDPLLPLGPEGGQVHPTERDIEVVPVRADRSGPTFDIGAVRLSEHLGVLFEGRTMPVAYRGLLGAI